jgi:two-component system sensor histidine kinase KdpD
LRGSRPTVIPNITEAVTRSIGLPTWFVDWLSEQGLVNVVVVPLLVHGRTVGTITLASRDETRRYDAADLALATALGRRCAAAVDYSRLAASAQEAAQAHEDFVASTSHELRTPLSHIKGFVSTLRTTDMDWDSETRGDFLGEIEREADRLTRLVENLLDMSRINSASPDTTPRAAHSPVALVAAGTDRVGGSIGDHQLEIEVPEDLPLVWVEASQVERVVANLLDNAGKYSPAGQPIRVIGQPTGDTVTIRVEDRGMGVPLEHLERIFEPFYREPTDGYPPKPGTGLGLAICRSIVSAQGGIIWAEPRVGGGSAFVFTLPVAGNRKG